MWLRLRLTAAPPLRPASRASSRENSWAVPFMCAARPPLLAISFCLWASIEAKPRRLVPGMLTPFVYFALMVLRTLSSLLGGARVDQPLREVGQLMRHPDPIRATTSQSELQCWCHAHRIGADPR